MALANKWATFVAGGVIQTFAGMVYMFSIYSPVLKERLHLSQSQLQGVATAMNVGGFLSLSGFLYDGLAHRPRLGPQLTLLVALVQHGIGYAGIWTIVSGRWAATYWQLLLVAAFAANGAPWADATSLLTNLRNFPNARGTVVGLLKSMLGVSASMHALVYAVVFAPHARSALHFLLYIAAVPPVLGALAMPFLNHVPYVQKSELKTSGWRSTQTIFNFALNIMLVLIAYQSMATLMVSMGMDRGATGKCLLGGLATILAALFTCIPSLGGGLRARPAHLHLHHDAAAPAADAEAAGAPTLFDAAKAPRAGGGGKTPLRASPDAAMTQRAADEDGLDAPLLSARLERQRSKDAEGAQAYYAEPEDLTCGEALRTARFWLLTVACAIGMGSGLVIINNLGQMVTSLGGAPNSQDALVAVLSIANCSGRLATGRLSEAALHSRGVPRPVWLVGASAATLLAALLGAVATSPAMLFPMVAVEGAAFGAFMTTMPPVASEIFGLHHFGTIYMALQLAPAAGSFVLSTRLAGFLYDNACHTQGLEPGMPCIGTVCFRYTFFTLALLAALGVLTSAALVHTTRHIYVRDFKHLYEIDHGLEEEPSIADPRSRAHSIGGASLSSEEPSFGRR